MSLKIIENPKLLLCMWGTHNLVPFVYIYYSSIKNLLTKRHYSSIKNLLKKKKDDRVKRP